MSLLIDLVKQVKGKPTDKVTQSLYDKRTKICSLCPKKMITGNVDGACFWEARGFAMFTTKPDIV